MEIVIHSSIAVLRFLGALGLLLLPGIPAAYPLLRRHFDFGTTFAAAIALAPFVVGAEWILLSVLHVPFYLAVPLMAVIGLAGLLWLRTEHFSLTKLWRAADPRVLTAFMFLVLPLVCVWVLVPGMRLYGYHNMMQLAALYQIPDLPHLPEDWDMAGLRLNYPWFGLIHLTATAWMIHASPTQVFPVSNVIQLAAWIWLVRGIQQFVESRAGTVTTVILYFLAVGSARPFLLARGLYYEGRLDPPIVKFLFIDAMTIGLALTALVVLITTAYLRGPFKGFPLAVGVICMAEGLSYPLLYPAVAVILFSAFVSLDSGRARLAFLRAAAPGFVLSTLVVGAYLKIIGSDGASHVRLSLTSGYIWHLTYPVWQLGPWVALILLFRRGIRRTLETRFLLIATALLAGCYIVIRLPLIVEYKFIAAALICVAPMAAALLSNLSGRYLKGSAYIIAALLLFSVLDTAALLRYASPRNLAMATGIQEGSFFVDPVTPESGSWMRAITTLTPRQTILLGDQSYFPGSVLTRRAMYLAPDPPQSTRPGYSMQTKSTLIDMKGYRLEEYSRRSEVVQAVFGHSAGADFPRVTERLLELGRPVAAVLDSSSTYSQWMRSSHRGEPVFDDGKTVVWLINGSTAGP
jgi:hypothetical protein